jgi:hypothetical protein
MGTCLTCNVVLMSNFRKKSESSFAAFGVLEHGGEKGIEI